MTHCLRLGLFIVVSSPKRLVDVHIASVSFAVNSCPRSTRMRLIQISPMFPTNGQHDRLKEHTYRDPRADCMKLHPIPGMWTGRGLESGRDGAFPIPKR